MTISVDYAASYARASRVNRPPDIIIFGENMAVESPSYALQQDTTASGPSVATALASGMASLILEFAKNCKIDRWESLKVRKNMVELFKVFKVDEQNNVPYVDPKRVFDNLKNLQTQIQSVLNKYLLLK
jgi:hypothetical protein